MDTDEDADYPRRKPQWAGCGERPGCGADDCPTCRPGCDQSGDEDEESDADKIERLEKELAAGRRREIELSRQNAELRRHLSPPPDHTFPAVPQTPMQSLGRCEQSNERPSIVVDNGGK